jgi:hypothetical protein
MSSRNAPAQRKQQSVEDFLDEDELEEKRKRGMTLTVNRDCDALCCDVLGGGNGDGRHRGQGKGGAPHSSRLCIMHAWQSAEVLAVSAASGGQGRQADGVKAQEGLDTRGTRHQGGQGRQVAAALGPTAPMPGAAVTG